MKLTITAGTGAQYVSYLRRHVQGAGRILDPSYSQLSIALVNDMQMGQLHKRFMQIDGPTDVLTFPLEFDSRNRVTSGEIIICVPEARRRAKEMKVAVQNELLLYALHGMLHLSGFDDRTRRGFRIMHETEDKILRELGVGAVFEPKDEGRRACPEYVEGMKVARRRLAKVRDEMDPRPPARKSRPSQSSRHRNARFTNSPSSFRLHPSSFDFRSRA